MGLAQDRETCRALVNSVMNLRVSYDAGKPRTSYTTGGLSSSAQFRRDSFLVSKELERAKNK
jgi:hypothetical protein